MLPRCKAEDWPHAKPIEFVQGPGETVFLPGGWWHAVVNLDTAIAVTQNFCSKTNFRVVWPRVVRGRPKMSQKMYKEMKRSEPELARQAKAMDTTARDELPSDSSSDSSDSSSTSCSSDSQASSDEETKRRAKKLTKRKRKDSKGTGPGTDKAMMSALEHFAGQ